MQIFSKALESEEDFEDEEYDGYNSDYEDSDKFLYDEDDYDSGDSDYEDEEY
ncbi:hypothetical protein [Helicobacter rodentium]|uniref:hypothetical protein n=1 Tax=Helicobacter rodentium TaxID=59617 RepID=UPI000B1F8A78|nr:hypothetical protein [Helicobacter rodentium]